ncbi:hypothetical protein B0T24DRAFT_11062 [Lasiosphaeria ovina]|uniref:Uncharacterized protein n=1 Tax=Lasiosphaeria ovina TaxID=92902 RepID=A0AAE0NJ72_9PEZI|nr:hypothetical protein B0T24DRAFT_11062 [Lasiosphaeria ovina]
MATGSDDGEPTTAESVALVMLALQWKRDGVNNASQCVCLNVEFVDKVLKRVHISFWVPPTPLLLPPPPILERPRDWDLSSPSLCACLVGEWSARKKQLYVSTEHCTPVSRTSIPESGAEGINDASNVGLGCYPYSQFNSWPWLVSCNDDSFWYCQNRSSRLVLMVSRLRLGGHVADCPSMQQLVYLFQSNKAKTMLGPGPSYVGPGVSATVNGAVRSVSRKMRPSDSVPRWRGGDRFPQPPPHSSDP